MSHYKCITSVLNSVSISCDVSAIHFMKLLILNTIYKYSHKIWWTLASALDLMTCLYSHTSSYKPSVHSFSLPAYWDATSDISSASSYLRLWCFALTHWGRVTHICVDNLTVTGSDNGLSPGRHQAIIRTNDGILLMRPSGTNFSEVIIEIHIFHWRKCIENVAWKMTAISSRRQCVKKYECIYSQFPTFPDTDMTQVGETFACSSKPFILHIQYHACWCPDDRRSQGIGSHAIYLIDVDVFWMQPKEGFINVL